MVESLQNLLNDFLSYLPNLLYGIILILVAWIIAVLIKNGIAKGLEAINFDSKLQDWGVANDSNQANNTIQSLARVFYYLVWVLFLPGIFSAFGLNSVAQPITNMIDTALAYLPNVIAAIVIVVLGILAARFVKNLVYNLLVSLNVDKAISRFTGEDGETVSEDRKDTIASVLANVVYILILIPILIVALETLGIRSISIPIINVLNAILAAIPNILVAGILLAVGFAIAKVVGDLTQDILEGAGVNRITDYISGESGRSFNIAKIIGQLVMIIIGLFFLVEAMNALNLAILNTIGTAIIGYLPNIIFALIILGLGIIGGQLLGQFVTNAAGSRWFGEILKYLVLALSVFMALDQLNFATSIVNTAFIFIVGAGAVAFALAFGLGGRDFAKSQLNKLDKKLDKEMEKDEKTESVQETLRKRREEFEKASTNRPTTDSRTVSKRRVEGGSEDIERKKVDDSGSSGDFTYAVNEDEAANAEDLDRSDN